MQTIQLQIDDALYKKLQDFNIDIEEEAYKHLEECVEDDGYPAISFEEAKARVSRAVEDYKSGNVTYLTQEEFKAHNDKFMEELRVKYADN